MVSGSQQGQRVGFAGLGNLGTPMAKRIAAASLPLTVWARSPRAVEAFRATPTGIAATLRELGEASDIVGLCLPDEEDLVEVFEGGLLEGLADRDAVVVVHSTVLPAACERLALMAAEHKVRVIDAPLCGGPNAAVIGQLPIPVGGEARAVEHCLPVLRTFGGLIRHVGPLGAGQRLKLMFNLLYAANVEIIHDALGVGSQLGLDHEMLSDFFTALPYQGFVGSPLATGRAGAAGVAHGRRMLKKDVDYARALLAADGVDGGTLVQLGDAALESLGTTTAT